ncbi:MAG: hypothetical protein VX293_12800, partial [Candidatus Latescibacterota bacterium]|nr:hypothetical protein [Candidatus Latescibacterota bacterium]
MVRLEDLAPGILVKGVLPESPVAITGVRWHGAAGIELKFADAQGHKEQILLCREHERGLEIVDNQREWSFEADGSLWRLAAAARSLATDAHRGASHLYGVRLVAHLGQLGDEDLAAAVQAKITEPQFFAMTDAPTGADLGAFFDAALTALGGRGTPLREGCYEIATLPESLGDYGPLPKIIDFNPSADPDIESIDPGHGLVHALTRRMLDEYGAQLRRGSVLVTPGSGPLRACLLVEQAIGQTGGGAEESWCQLQWVEVDAAGQTRCCPESSWWVLRTPSPDEQPRIAALRDGDWTAVDIEEQALA